MHAITVWWGSLAVFSQVFWGIAVFGSVIVAMQILSMFLGLEHVGSDGDASLDVHDGGSTNHGFMAGMKLFTLRSMVAFLCMFGWTGVVMLEQNTSKILTCLVAFVVGCFSMFLMAVMMKFIYSMQTSGNINEAALIGKEATVYIAIPEKGKGIGKININIGGKQEERQAMSKDVTIYAGTLVKTVSYTNNIFTVERV